MKLENQVCSLELAKKLKELGVKQESLWYWVAVTNEVQRVERVVDENKFVEIVTKHEVELNEINYPKIDFKILCSAFTVAELGEMLPKIIRKNNINFVLHTFPDIQFDEKDRWTHQGYNCVYWNIEKKEHLVDRFSKTEANARAKMLIYLIEKSFLKGCGLC